MQIDMNIYALSISMTADGNSIVLVFWKSNNNFHNKGIYYSAALNLNQVIHQKVSSSKDAFKDMNFLEPFT